MAIVRLAAPYLQDIVSASAASGVPQAILYALLNQESSFAEDVINGTRKSSAGAAGIAQFMPDTAAAYGIDPTNPHEAIPAAADYLARLHRHYDGDPNDWTFGLVAYNGGGGAVAAWKKGAAYQESRDYVESITSQAAELERGGSPRQQVSDPLGGGGTGDTTVQIDGAGRAYIVKDGKAVFLDGGGGTLVPTPVNPNPGRSSSTSLDLTPKPKQAIQDGTGQVFIYDPNTGGISNSSVRLDVAKSLTPQIDKTTGELVLINPATGEVFRTGQKVDYPQLDPTKTSPDTAANITQRQAEAAQQAETERAKLHEQTRSNIAQEQFLHDKLAVETNASERQNISNQIYQLQRDRAQMVEQGRQFNITQRETVARDIAQYSSQPTDVGKLAALLLAGGPNAISTALSSGETAITDKSLAPLQLMLQQRDELSKPLDMGGIDSAISGDRARLPALLAMPPYRPSAAPLTPAQQMAGLIDEQRRAGIMPATNGVPTGSQVAPAPAPLSLPAGMDPASQVQRSGSGTIFNGEGTGATWNWDPAANNWGVSVNQPVKSAAMGGSMDMTQAPQAPQATLDLGGLLDDRVLAFPISMFQNSGGAAGGKSTTIMEGDKQLMETGQRSGNEELTTVSDPTGDARVKVTPIGKGDALPGNVTPMATGGLIDFAAMGIDPSMPVAQARNFQQGVGQSVRANSPWRTQQTPIGLSTPGTSDYLRTLAAAEAAAGRGIDPRVFGEEVQRLIPMGMPMSHAVRRTA